MTLSIIYDFETLGQIPEKSVVLSMGILSYNEDRFLQDEGYTYEELLGDTNYIKFNVEEQVKHFGRTIDPNTLEWWKSQGETAKHVLKPSTDDVSISELKDWIETLYDVKSFKKVFTRGNTFDPMFLRSLTKDDVFNWWSIRDTRSYIDGMLIGNDELDNKFIPEGLSEKFVHHDARHDIVIDVMRMQTLFRAILL